MSAAEAKPFEKCGECGHYPAYHDVDEAGHCRAWVADDTPDGKCACKGWKPPKADAPVAEKPWGHERADLQGGDDDDAGA